MTISDRPDPMFVVTCFGGSNRMVFGPIRTMEAGDEFVDQHCDSEEALATDGVPQCFNGLSPSEHDVLQLDDPDDRFIGE